MKCQIPLLAANEQALAWFDALKSPVVPKQSHFTAATDAPP
ncbi:MAG TPA: hypothetical protein VGE41_12640 [Verrucomicrobiae bacterium]